MSFADELRATPEDMERSHNLKQAIIAEINDKPGGLMTYGEFVQRSLYGYDEKITGYYTNPSFTPNSADMDSANTFGTMVTYPGFGAAIGEKVVMELDGHDDNHTLSIIEVGGGDGTLMVNTIAGASRHLKQMAAKRAINPVMIDRTPQLLNRQREAIGALVQSGVEGIEVVDPVFIGSRVEEMEWCIRKVGAVVSNELLDMLPFEVAARTGDLTPGLFFVTVKDGYIAPVFAPASEEFADEADHVLGEHPEKLLQSFQPGLIPAMNSLTNLIDKGMIVTVDYTPGYEPDVQINRNNVQGVPQLEMAYPGLFDISVVPDWAKIVRWAADQYGPENVELDNLGDFILNTPSYDDIYEILPELVKTAAIAETSKNMARRVLMMVLDNYASLLIRK